MDTRKKDYKAWLYLLPIIVLMLVFTIYPLIKTILISFDPTYNPANGGVIHFNKFSLSSYSDIILGKKTPSGYTDGGFKSALLNTIFIVVITVPASMIVALGISVALMSLKKVRSFVQTIFFLPYVTNTIAIGLVFSVMFSVDGGLINLFLYKLGMISSPDSINWINEASIGHAKPTAFHLRFVALFYIIWQGLPFKILIFMGGLQSVNKQLYQAALIDATPKWRVFRKITVPQISPLLLYIFITSLIGSFKTYAAIVGLFPISKAPGSNYQRMNTIVGFIYDQIGADSVTFSRGAAAAVVLLIIILIFTAINTYFARKKVHY